MKKRSLYIRTAAAVICLLLTLTAASCGSGDAGDTETGGDDSSVTTVNTVDTAEPQTDSDNPVVLRIGDYDVYLDEYSYYYNNYKNNYDNGDESFWEGNEDLLAVVDQYVAGALRSNYAVFTLAAQNGITLDDEDRAEIASTLEQMKTYYGGDEGFESALNQYSMSRRYYENMLEYTFIENKLFEFLTNSENGSIKVTDDDIRADITSNYARVVHILIVNDDGEDIEANKTLAQSLLERAESGEDFMALVEEYGEDPGMEGNADGYYFTYNQMVKEFEDASFELNENEISGLVESSYGYHIIKRLPMEEEYIAANLDSFRQNYLAIAFYDMVDETAAALNISAVPADDTEQ